MFSLFAQARHYAPLSPGQRALLKLAEGLLCPWWRVRSAAAA
jgi:hypothetical protein